MIAQGDTSALRLPPERFFWGVLDTSLLRSSGRSRGDQFGYLFEPFLPVPLEEVHTVYTRIDDEHVLGCAIERRILDEEVPPTALSLHPEAAPTDLEISEDRLTRLNLLTGRYTPPPIRKIERRLRWRLFIIALVAFLLVVVGLERRIKTIDREADSIGKRLDDVYRAVLGPKASNALQPRALQITAELRRLERTRSDDALATIALLDAARELEQLLASWPKGAHLTTETITVTPSSITVRAQVPTDETQAATEALGPWGQWRRMQPEINNSTSGLSTVTIRFTRTQEKSTP